MDRVIIHIAILLLMLLLKQCPNAIGGQRIVGKTDGCVHENCCSWAACVSPFVRDKLDSSNSKLHPSSSSHSSNL